MRITVTVVPRARRTYVEPLQDGGLRVAVTAAPQEGQANAAVIAALAVHFHIPRSRVRIVHGERSRKKVVEITTVG